MADLLKTPNDVFVGEVGGVGANSKGQIFVYTRTGHPYGTMGDNRTFYRNGSRLFLFDQTGKFVREWGQDVYGFNAAFGLRIDPQDNVWTIDEGANQVVKFDSRGPGRAGARAQAGGDRRASATPRPAPAAAGRAAGRALRADRGDRAAECEPQARRGHAGILVQPPSDVAWDAAGNIYVADGMGANNRVAKLDKDGRFIKHWGSTGSEPGEFQGLKAIAIDAKGTVYVADAGNKRIQVFDADGTFKSEFGNIGTPLAMCMTRGATQHLYVSHAGDTDGMEDAAIFKVRLDGTVVGKFGRPGRCRRSSVSPTPSTAATRTSC